MSRSKFVVVFFIIVMLVGINNCFGQEPVPTYGNDVPECPSWTRECRLIKELRSSLTQPDKIVKFLLEYNSEEVLQLQSGVYLLTLAGIVNEGTPVNYKGKLVGWALMDQRAILYYEVSGNASFNDTCMIEVLPYDYIYARFGII